MFRQCEFTTMVAAVHASNLGDADVAFIGKNNRMIGNKFKQCGGRLSGCASCQIAGIVFDAIANASRL